MHISEYTQNISKKTKIFLRESPLMTMVGIQVGYV